MYENGKGVPKDLSEAIRLYQLAARSGHEFSQNALKRLGRSW
jgi:TPR repeat protein